VELHRARPLTTRGRFTGDGRQGAAQCCTAKRLELAVGLRIVGVQRKTVLALPARGGAVVMGARQRRRSDGDAA
jgi:hypothetical protein